MNIAGKARFDNDEFSQNPDFSDPSHGLISEISLLEARQYFQKLQLLAEFGANGLVFRLLHPFFQPD